MIPKKGSFQVNTTFERKNPTIGRGARLPNSDTVSFVTLSTSKT